MNDRCESWDILGYLGILFRIGVLGGFGSLCDFSFSLWKVESTMSTELPGDEEGQNEEITSVVGDIDHKDEQKHNASAEAAGVARGAARSLGRSVVRSPIGSIPRRAVFRRRLPLRQVAKVSDRISTGIDLWSSAAVEDQTQDGRGRTVNQQSFRSKWIPRVKAFTGNLLKNTFLGAAVFETYGYTITKLAPIPEENERRLEEGKLHYSIRDDEEEEVRSTEADEFARATLPAHFGAGFAAGSIHGVGSTFMEVTSAGGTLFRSLRMNAIHHSCAHSLLFGSYEGLKRASLEQVTDDGTQYYGEGYLLSFGLAGGMAGQIQHVASHYMEQWLGITSAPNTTNTTTVRGASATLEKFVATAPALRPTLFAFIPSAIGFVAFEYGKKFTT